MIVADDGSTEEVARVVDRWRSRLISSMSGRLTKGSERRAFLTAGLHLLLAAITLLS